MRAMITLVALLILAAPAAATTRILFSNYAPEAGAVSLRVDGEPVAGPIDYPDTDTQYRLVEVGEVTLSIVRPGQGVVTSRTVTLEAGDYSVFLHMAADDAPTIAVARDALAGFDFPAPFDLETNDGNAAGRVLSFARFPVEGPLAMVGTATQIFTQSDGDTVEGGQVQVTAFLDDFGEAAIAGAFPANVNSIVSNPVVVEAGIASQTAGTFELEEVLVGGEFTLPVGTTDYVIIGDADSLQVVERRRPGNRSARLDGLYGETGINGSGLQLYELPDIGRIYGLLYTYREDGSPVWYYLDSRCDLERGFQCTTPGLLVANGSYLAAVYEASNGRLAPGADADLNAVGSAWLVIPRTQAAFIEAEAPETAQVMLFLNPPTLEDPGIFGEPDAVFSFERLAR